MNTSDETKAGGKFPSNIMTTQDELFNGIFLVPKPGKKEKSEFNTHLSVKPVELVEHLIRLFTPKMQWSSTLLWEVVRLLWPRYRVIANIWDMISTKNTSISQKRESRLK